MFIFLSNNNTALLGIRRTIKKINNKFKAEIMVTRTLDDSVLQVQGTINESDKSTKYM